jgi:hypothetical protein
MEHNKTFLSFNETVSALDCSKGFLYKLIERKIITPKYILRKPYFSIKEIEAAMTPTPTK